MMTPITNFFTHSKPRNKHIRNVMKGDPPLPESKGIELKSFAFNINYDIMSSVVVMYS